MGEAKKQKEADEEVMDLIEIIGTSSDLNMAELLNEVDKIKAGTMSNAIDTFAAGVTRGGIRTRTDRQQVAFGPRRMSVTKIVDETGHEVVESPKFSTRTTVYEEIM